MCNIGDEAPNEYLKNPSDLMSIASGDTVTVNPKGRPAFEATFKLFNIFSGNYIPTSSNKSTGWYRRMLIVPFNADFNGEKEKRWIKNEFLADKSVLEYALYRAVQQPNFEHFIEPKVTRQLMSEYRVQNDSLHNFVENVYIANGWYKMPIVPVHIIKRLYEEYSESIEEGNTNFSRVSTKITQKLTELLPQNTYTLKRARIKSGDLEQFNQMELTEKERSNLQKVHQSIVLT